MRIGAHVSDENPVQDATERNAAAVQFFLPDPQSWTGPPADPLVAQHAVAAATIGAHGLVVHGGHVTKGEDPATGFENWRKMFARQSADGGFGTRILVE